MTSSFGRSLIYRIGGILTRLAERDWGKATELAQRLYLTAHLAGKRLLDGRELKALAALAQPGMVVCDVGANVGITTVTFAQRVGPGGRVLAFEPDPFNATVFRRHLKRGPFANVTLYEIGLDEGPGTRHLRINPASRADSRIVPAGVMPLPGTVTVPCDSLDAVLARIQVDRVDLIKIDVQGFEPFVLRGMHITLAKNPGIQMVLELYPDGLAEQGQAPQSLLDFLFDAFPVVEPWTGSRWTPLHRHEAANWLKTFGRGAYTDLWCHP